MKYIVASVEDGIIRLECENSPDIFVSADNMPSDIKEGTVLHFDGEKYSIDTTATETRKKDVYEKFNRLFRKQ